MGAAEISANQKMGIVPYLDISAKNSKLVHFSDTAWTFGFMDVIISTDFKF
jgi:hypothetical protein